MSWPETTDDREPVSRRRLLGALLLVGLATPLLAACAEGGFRPLYGPTASGAVPALEKLAGGGDAEVRAAAKAAVTAIKRR